MSIILVLHDWVRWLIMVFALLTVLTAFTGLLKNSPYTKFANISNLLFMIGMDIQVVFGFILYFNNGWFDILKHIGSFMGQTMPRFFGLEHWLMMIIAWVLVHSGRTVVKRVDTPREKYKKTLIYFGIALLIILIAIPWPFRTALGRPWIRWF